MLKSKLVTIALITLLLPLSYAQEMQEIFDPKGKVTWLGLDFTGARLIGDRERLGSTSDVQHLIVSWNDLLIKEKEKYDIGLAIDKVKVEEAIEVTKENNASLDVTEVFSNDVKDHMRLKPDHIAAIISDYDFKGKTGIGLMFNVESFSKLNEEAAIWVTFVNMGTKDIYFTERLTQKPGGFGMRNYWGGAIYGMMKNIQKREFEMWRKKYYRK